MKKMVAVILLACILIAIMMALGVDEGHYPVVPTPAPTPVPPGMSVVWNMEGGQPWL